ncbi:hypothetical protein LCGC14_0938200 [marine sediment metagenome]|uniref:Transcription factor zinc-finger domain-containing protein n=1 Tax=marine sediment metagenome TaxID=412755 RepID=A0A0F9NQI7_9ZZZZ
MTKLEQNENGNYLCPHCKSVLTPIIKDWMNAITDYLCHQCKVGLKVLEERGILAYGKM